MQKCNKCSNTDQSQIAQFNFKGQFYSFCTDCLNEAFKSISPDVYTELRVNYHMPVLLDIFDMDDQVRFSVLQKLVGEKKTTDNVLKFTRRPKNAHVKECPVTKDKTYTPTQVMEHLNKHIIGQDNAKKAMSLAFARFQMAQRNKKINKMNIILVGPTASGKTEMARSLSKMAGVEMLKVDCSHLTPTGYKGDNVKDILVSLYKRTGGDVLKVEKSIVLLDEFDKLKSNGNDDNSLKLKTQQELLKMIEGDKFDVEIAHNKTVTIDTSNIMFIAAGAFVGLDKIVTPKVRKNIGLSSVNKEVLQEKENDLKIEHLLSFGLIPELVGRFTQVATLKKLEKDQLRRVLCEKEDNLMDEYTHIFNEMGMTVELTDAFFEEVIELASKNPTGARGLRVFTESLLEEVLYTGQAINSKYVRVKEFDQQMSA